MTVRVCLPPTQSLHEPGCQEGLQATTVQDSETAGLFTKDPQPLESVQVLECFPLAQLLQAVQFQLVVQFELAV